MNNQSILLATALAVAVATTVVSGCDRRDANKPPAPGSTNGAALLANPPATAPESETGQGVPRQHFVRIATDAANQKLSHADVSFLKNAASGGLFEVEAGQTGSRMASDAGVKSFEFLVKIAS